MKSKIISASHTLRSYEHLEKTNNAPNMKTIATASFLLVFALSISTVFSQTIYYSRANGDWSSVSTWSTANCGGGISASIPTGADGVIICAGHVITLSQDISIHDLAVNYTGQLDVTTDNFNIGIGGNLVNNGTVSSPGFDARSGTVTLNGVSAQTIEGETEFNDLVIDNNAGVTISNGVQGITGTLTLTDGILNTNDSLTLRSDINQTARISEITGGSLTGDIITERYVQQGDNNWRFFSAPVSGATLAEWQDDFVTSGFPGSDYPNFGFTSIYTYNESVLGPSSDGYTPPTNITDPINIGEGYWIYLGPLPLTFEVKGPTNSGNISLPVTFTEDVSQPASENGWNMVGNPYASSIDWDSPNWTKTNVGSTIYIYKEDGSYAAYPAGGPGTNGGTKDIASSQGFWVQTTGPNPVLTASEGVKSTPDAIFLKTSGPIPYVRLSINSGGYTDEAIIRFHPDASDGLDNLDGYKLANSNPQIPNISTTMDGEDLVINSMSNSADEFSIPVKALFENTGTYTIQISSSGMEVPSNSMFVLEDLVTGSITDLNIYSSLTFTITSLSSSPRFMLHLQKGFDHSISNVSCNGHDNGSVIVTALGNGPWDYIWIKTNGDTMQTTFNSTSTDTIQGLEPGSYVVHISDQSGYYTDVNTEFTITEPFEVSASVLVSEPSCYGGNNGSIQLNVSGGVGTYDYLWTNGEITDVLTNLAAGSYVVSISDQNSCGLSISILVNEPTELTPSSQSTNISCNGDADGEISLAVTGGVAPYNYIWSNGETTKDLTDLSAGIFEVTITDYNGCTINSVVGVTEPEEVIASFDIVNNIVQLTDGGVGEFKNTSTGADTYLWDFTGGNYSTEENPTYTYSAPGFYMIYLTSSKGQCESQSNGSIQIEDNSTDIAKANGNKSISVTQVEAGIAINFDFDEPQFVTISIYNLAGQSIVYNVKQQVTQETINYNLNSSTSGIYLINVEYNDQVVVTKLMIQSR